MSSTKKIWTEIIEKKLKKGLSVSDITYEYPGGIVMDPHVVKEEIEGVYMGKSSVSEWVHMVNIKGKDSTHKNKLAHEALKYGVGGISFDVAQGEDEDKLTQGILSEYVLIRMVRDQDEIVIIAQDTTHQNAAKLINQCAGKGKIEIIVFLGKDILYEISRLRAIRRYCEFLGISEKTTIITRYDTEGSNEMGDFDLIEKTYKAYSAIMGGADIILTDFEGSEADRLEINIYHILEYEAGLKWVSDPVKGSFFIEKLTNEIYNQMRNTRE